MRKWTPISLLAAATLLGGCGADVAEAPAFESAWGDGGQASAGDDAATEDTEGTAGDDGGAFDDEIPEVGNRCEDLSPPPVDTSAPLFLYYGAYNQHMSGTATMELVTSGTQVDGEPVLAINRGGVWDCQGPSAWEDAGGWLAQGGKVALTINACELQQVTADHLEGLLRSGFHYIAVDELAYEKHFNEDKPQNCHYAKDAGWRDGDPLAQQFEALASELAARGFDRRLILYVNTYNLDARLAAYDDDPMAGKLKDYRDVLTVCRDHCRVLASEMYMNTKRILGEVTLLKEKHCHWDLGCLDATARELDHVVPGLNQRTITVLGLASENNEYTVSDHPHGLCEGPGIGGGLFRQYHRLHAGAWTRRQPGVGGYALTHVGGDNVYRREQAKCLEKLNRWHGWPRAGSLPYSLIWIANSEQGTVSKIDTATGVELARYYTGPSMGADDPSRTSVSYSGDVAVTNRAGSMVKIAAREDRCEDRNGNGSIETSSGPGDLRPFGSDECVLWHVDLPSDGDNRHGPRPTAWDYIAHGNDAMDADDRVWVGWFDHAANTGRFRRLHGSDGTVLDEVAVPAWDPSGTSHWGPYGGAVDGEGSFWVVGRNPGPLVRIDAITLDVDRWEVPAGTAPYGLAMDADGVPWMAGTNGQVLRFDPGSETFESIPIQGAGALRGLQIDLRGRAWIASNAPCGVVEVDTGARQQVGDLIALPGCQTPVGVGIANEESVWVPDLDANLAFQLDTRTFAVETTPGLVRPYTYSDMTGAGLHLVSQPPVP